MLRVAVRRVSTGAGRALPPHIQRKQALEESGRSATSPPRDLAAVAQEELLRVQEAMTRMREANPNLTVEKWDRGLDIDLGGGLGTYQIKFLVKTERLQLDSPKSGSYLYSYSAERKKWVGVTDGHDFEGMLTRDLIQQANGYPDF